MRGFNKVFLMGYLGSQPEVLVSKTGTNYAKLNMAVHRYKQASDGKWETLTEWHRIMVWGKKAELCSQHLSKGAPVAVEGHLSQHTVKDSEGREDRQTTITANEVHFLPNPKQVSLPL